MIAGLALTPLSGNFTPPCRVRGQVAVLHRALQNARQQHPGIACRLPAGFARELLRNPLLNREPFNVAQGRAPDGRETHESLRDQDARDRWLEEERPTNRFTPRTPNGIEGQVLSPTCVIPTFWSAKYARGKMMFVQREA